MIERRLGLHFVRCEAQWFGRGIGVECGSIHPTSSRPEARAAYFVRVGFSRDRIGAGTSRGNAAAEACGCEVKTSPKEMHGTGLPSEMRPKLLEHGIAPHQDSPKTVHRNGI